MLKKAASLLVIFYKKFISPALHKRCVYTPTCSAYMLDAIDEYGAIRGVAMGVWRLIRCNPFSKGGYDPVRPNLRGNAKWIL